MITSSKELFKWKFLIYQYIYKVSMGLTVSRKKANKFRRQAKKIYNFYRPFFGKKFTVSHKMEKM